VLVEIGGVQISRTKLIASQVDSRNSLMVYWSCACLNPYQNLMGILL